MALRKVHIDKISHLIAVFFTEKRLNLAPEGVILGKISSILNENMEKERAIDIEAHKLLDKNRRMMNPDIDEAKAFMMIKKQLAKQKNFVL